MVWRIDIVARAQRRSRLVTTHIWTSLHFGMQIEAVLTERAVALAKIVMLARNLGQAHFVVLDHLGFALLVAREVHTRNDIVAHVST